MNILNVTIEINQISSANELVRIKDICKGECT